MALPLQQNLDAQQKLATRLYRDFHAMKTYGKEPESLESIISLFNETLAEYPFEEINAAMAAHAKGSPEFPTPADVISIIKKDRAERARRENIVAIGVDDTVEKLAEYKRKKSQGIPLTAKEYRLLQECGWKLECVRRS